MAFRNLTQYLQSFNAKLSFFLYLFIIIALHFKKHGVQVQTATLSNIAYLIVGAFTCMLVPIILENTVKNERMRRFSLLIFFTTYLFFSICHYRFPQRRQLAGYPGCPLTVRPQKPFSSVFTKNGVFFERFGFRPTRLYFFRHFHYRNIDNFQKPLFFVVVIICIKHTTHFR